MSEIDLTNVRAFYEVSRLRSFSEAAEVLNISQPAVSMRVRSLEEHLGVSLFERGPLGTKLSPAGQTFVPIADQLLRLSAQAQQTVRPELKDLQGQLTIACASSAGKYLLPELVAAFLRQSPNVDVLIPVVSRGELLQGLSRGEYDIGVTSRRVEGGELEYSPFITDHLSLVVPAAHPWAHRGRVKPAELIGQRFICREPDSACREIVSASLEPHGVDLNDMLIVMEVGSPEALAMAVERGIGIAFVSKLAALPRVSLGRLAMIEVEGANFTNPVEWAQSPTRPASRELLAFMEVAQQSGNQKMLQNLAEGQIL